MSFLDRLRHKPREASTAELRAFFNHAASDEEHYPSTIDPRIFHVKLILEHMGDLSGKLVADVGCGKGRFARVIQDRYPRARVCAIDIAEAMLQHVPKGIYRAAASHDDGTATLVRLLRRRLCHRIVGARGGYSKSGGGIVPHR